MRLLDLSSQTRHMCSVCAESLDIYSMSDITIRSVTALSEWRKMPSFIDSATRGKVVGLKEIL